MEEPKAQSAGISQLKHYRFRNEDAVINEDAVTYRRADGEVTISALHASKHAPAGLLLALKPMDDEPTQEIVFSEAEFALLEDILNKAKKGPTS